MKQIESLKLKLKSFYQQNPRLALILIVVFLGVISFYWDKKEMPLQRPEAVIPEAADTYIPEGFVLVPITVSNYESLDSILGHHGVVDLYASTQNGEKSRRVARQVKILRAPLNPSNFAVLAPEANSAELVRHQGAFFVVVQNPKRSGTNFEKRSTRVRRITVEQGYDEEEI